MITSEDPRDKEESTEAPLAPVAKGLPVLGNTFQFLNDTTKLLLDSYRKLGPVYRLRALWLKYTVIGGVEARDFMREGLDDQYLSREAVFAEVGRQLGSADFVLGQSGENHARFRKLLSLAYSREVASPWVPDLITAVRDSIKSWEPGSLTGVMEQAQILAFEQYCRVMCGKSLKPYYRDCIRVTDYNMNVGGRVWPFFMYRMPWYQASRKRVLDLMWGMVKQRRSHTMQAGEKATIMDTLLTLRDNKGQSLTDDEVVCYSMYGFAGSCSYMGRLIGFMLYELLKHPDLLADVRAEVDEVFAGGLDDASDVRKLKLLQAVYNESLRFHPVSQGMPHVAAKDFVFHGKKVQKGDLTVLSQVPMSFSQCPFSNPEEFDPSRCLEPRNEHKKENSFHPFGIGHRTCTATGLVELMALTLVATLIHEFRFSMSPADYQLKLKIKPLPAPDDNFRLRIESRRTAGDRKEAVKAPNEEQIVASMLGHDDPEVLALLEKAHVIRFAPGAVILREGEASDAFYVVADGSVTVSRLVGNRPQLLATLDEGDYFGEIGLLQHTPRTATVTAAGTGANVLKLDYDAFEDLIASSDLLSRDVARILQKRIASQRLAEALPGLTSELVHELLPEFITRHFNPGETIIREGDKADHFYVLVEGDVVITRSNPDTQNWTTTLSPGQYFGEIGLLTGTPRNATVTAGAKRVTVMETDTDGFHSVLQETGGLRGNLAQSMMRRFAVRLSPPKE